MYHISYFESDKEYIAWLRKTYGEPETERNIMNDFFDVNASVNNNVWDTGIKYEDRIPTLSVDEISTLIYNIAEQLNLVNTEKQLSVIQCLQRDFHMETKTVIKEVDEMWEGRITVSERYVQKIRKLLKDTVLKYIPTGYVLKEKIKKEKEGKKVMHGNVKMFDWEINVLNKANEGGWSVQDLATEFGFEPQKVRHVLITFKDMIKVPIMDEDTKEDFDVDNNSGIFIYGKTALTVVPEPEPASDEEYWEIEIDCVTECSKVEKEVPVFLNKVARTKAMNFMRWAKRREWLAYLIGEKKEDGYYIYDLFLPDQRTSASLVDKVVAETYNEMKIVGVIHSHHEMGAGDEDKPTFSGHDANFINGNHNLSLLAGRDRETKGFKIVGIARAKTPCGALLTIKACVKAMPEEPSEEESNLKSEFFKKVLKGKGKGFFG